MFDLVAFRSKMKTSDTVCICNTVYIVHIYTTAHDNLLLKESEAVTAS